jgi:hypothetical protein
MSDDQNTLIPAKQLRARYGDVSHMWIERKLANDPTFPRPVYISTRRYWRVGDSTPGNAISRRSSASQAAAAGPPRRLSRRRSLNPSPPPSKTLADRTHRYLDRR